MKFNFANKSITGILTIIPQKVVRFDDEIANYSFSESQTKKLKRIMGYEKRHIVDEHTAGSDLVTYGLKYLIDNQYLAKDEIGGIIVVTQSPDYFLPPTSNIIHGNLKLSSEVYCVDINQGCAGYVVGLTQAFMLLNAIGKKKVLLVNVDVLSKKVSKYDRNSNPIIGDGASITIIENTQDDSQIPIEVNMDGSGWNVLQIPAGGFRTPSSKETAKMVQDSAGNKRSADNLVMRGDDVFNFVQTKVPPMIERLIDSSAIAKEEIDYYVFHQPNKFMLSKLADKLQVPREKVPSNIVENFGNASGVTIPTAITHNLEKELTTGSLKLCLAGFGVGLTWASMIIDINKLDICKIIYY
jgi:3-oxoacyl-[acyl-carrier-protein] synthase III